MDRGQNGVILLLFLSRGKHQISINPTILLVLINSVKRKSVA